MIVIPVIVLAIAGLCEVLVCQDYYTGSLRLVRVVMIGGVGVVCRGRRDAIAGGVVIEGGSDRQKKS